MQYQSDKFWSEEELRELILFTQSLRDENDELSAKIIVMDTMVKNKDATLRKANRYINQLELEISQLKTQNWN